MQKQKSNNIQKRELWQPLSDRQSAQHQGGIKLVTVCDYNGCSIGDLDEFYPVFVP